MVDSRCAITSVAVWDQLRQRVLHQPFGFVVERGGGLVEDQDRRILQHRAGDGQALALAARQLAALGADGVATPSGSFATNSIAFASRTAADPIRRCLVQLAVGHVVGHAAVEQQHLLADDGDLPAQVDERIVRERMAVQQDRPRSAS